jgi:hypothetical protein
MEITESTPEDEVKMSSESNDVEMKDESRQSLASESKGADQKEPATESKRIGYFEAETHAGGKGHSVVRGRRNRFPGELSMSSELHYISLTF